MEKKIFLIVFAFTISLIKAQKNDSIHINYQKQMEQQQQQIKELQEQMKILQAQNTSSLNNNSVSETKKESTEFKPKGRVFGRIFMGYANSLENKSDRRQGFDIARSYLGYDYQITENLSTRIMIDATPEGTLAQIGKENVQSLKTPALKNVYIKYETEKVSVTAGMFATPHVVIPLQYWENRYINKSFPIANGLARGADIGITGVYKIAPYLSVDAAILKGEGFRKISKDNMYQYVVAATITPFKNMIIRPLFDIKTGENLHRKDRMYATALIGYRNSKISAGAELSKVFNDGAAEVDKYGYSLFLNGKITKQIKIFGRADVYSTSLPESYYSGYDFFNADNKAFTGHTDMFIFGLEYIIAKGVKISPNFNYKVYKKAGDRGQDLHSNTLAVSMEIKI
ncbi:hypothetical protein O2K51_09225 [Apibacter raozihei]|uniref:hypothetical protein n=1 Tax=Apibacter raozihei TaxID=2500547 RepID=UPI000FE3B93D|nr:hypothetical protein [Apibacter raozihei]